MNTLPETYPKSEAPNFIDVVLRYWPIIITVALMVLGYGTLESNLHELQSKEATNEASILAANASYNEVSGDIKGINAKLDIIIKHSGL